jgi:hypothetical protein
MRPPGNGAGSNLVGRDPPSTRTMADRFDEATQVIFLSYFLISPYLTNLMTERTRSVFRATAGRDAVQQANSTVYVHVLGQVGVVLCVQTFIC